MVIITFTKQFVGIYINKLASKELQTFELSIN